MTDKTLTAGVTELIRKAASRPMTAEDRRAQKISFVYGQMLDCAPHITKEQIAAEIDALESKSATEIERKFNLSETELKRIGYGEQTDTTGLTGMEVLSIGPDLTYQRGRRDATNAILSSFSAHSGGTEIEDKLRKLAGDLDAAFHEDAAKDLTAAADELRRMRGEKYLIWSNEHQAWWRANSCGYTLHIEAAGQYERDEALTIARDAHDGWAPDKPPPELAVRVSDTLLAKSSLKDPQP